MGPIVSCVDDSETARKALGVARELAEALDRPLVLLHVAPSTVAPGLSAAPAGHQRLREEELEDANALLDRVADEAGLDRAVVRVAKIGDAATAIVAVCDEQQASFVVLGSRGRGGLKTTMLGSVSNAVVGNASCPVVLVPPHASDT
jgi:nucleotide-binding universal stress UspA family protein